MVDPGKSDFMQIYNIQCLIIIEVMKDVMFLILLLISKIITIYDCC